MRILLAFALITTLQSATCEAGILRRFAVTCANLLIADDPWPFGEYTIDDLAQTYPRFKDPQIEKEIRWRLDHMILKPIDRLKLLAALGESDVVE